jgi:hypothetical protein
VKGRNAGQPEAGKHPTKRERMLADLLHELSQPVTTLCCCLEISLQKARGVGSRHDLAIALHQAEAIAKLTHRIRALVEEGEQSREAKVVLLGVAGGRQSGNLGRHNFPISGGGPKTGNNLPL